MVLMRIEIDVQTEPTKKVEEETPQQQDTIYPTKPFGKRSETQMVLNILFFNGATYRDPNDPSGFSVWNKLDLCADKQYDQIHTTQDFDGSNTFQFHFVQNRLNVTDDDYFNFWNGDNPYDRQPFERYRYGDIEQNNGIMPVGAMKSNIEVSLVNRSGVELESMSAYKLLKGQLPGRFIDAAQGMGYMWLNPPAGVHVKIREKTAKSHYLMAAAGVGKYSADGSTRGEARADNEWWGDETVPMGTSRQGDYQMTDLFWHIFDTSDQDNFKLTKVPRYNCAPEDEYTDDHVLKLDSVYLELKLYLIPRPWLGMARYSTYTQRDQAGLNTDTIYGIWGAAPREFVMPTPRTSGLWEIGVGAPSFFLYNPRQWQGTSVPVTYTGEEKGIIFTLPGDSEVDNGFYLLHTVPVERLQVPFGYGNREEERRPIANVYAPWNPYGEFSGCPSYLFGQWLKDSTGLHFASFDTIYQWNWADLDCRKIACHRANWGYTYNSEQTLFSFRSRPSYIHFECFWGSAPDGKVPSMISRDTPSGVAPLKSGQTLPKSPLIYAPDSYQDKPLMNVIAKHFTSNPICSECGDPDSFLLSVGSAKEGDLVGVIVTRDQPIYVWRKTDETMTHSGAVGGETDDLKIADNPQWYFFGNGYYKHLAVIPCPEIYNCLPSTFQADELFIG